MRKAMQAVVRETIEQWEDTALLLVDIGVYPFRDLLARFPQRAKNIGIFEPGTLSLAAGLSLAGIVPTVYGISPFIVQRALEQLKLDFAYQEVGGNFITTGAAYDFSTLGYSHYCPEDVATLRLLPGLEVLAPGTPEQFARLFRACRRNGRPSYFRMTDHCNKTQVEVEFGRARVLRRGTQATVLAVAEQLDATLAACAGLDVTVLYYTTLAPFDYETLRTNCPSGAVFVSAPLYEGTLYPEICKALAGRALRLGGAELPLAILRNYGSKAEKDRHLGLDAPGIRARLRAFLQAAGPVKSRQKGYRLL